MFDATHRDAIRRVSTVSQARGTASASIIPGVQVPPLWVEWWYYAQIFYAVMGTALGLSVGFIGVSTLAVLAVSSVLRLGNRMLAVLFPLAPAFAFAATYLVIQIGYFHESPLEENMRPVFSWVLGLVTVQCLALRRGFLHRAVLSLTLIGALTLPYMTMYRGSATRMGLTAGISIANPNDYAAWFGLSALYFSVVALEARRMSIRMASGLAAVGCVFVMVLTVSRGSLFALAFALVVAFRRVLNRGFFAVLPLVVVSWIAFELGLFDQSAGLYASRGFEESGRLLVWPLAIARFLAAPFTGVGVSQVGTFVAEKTIDVTPHNQFIFVALASGVIPLAFFIRYWVALAFDALRLKKQRHEDAVLLVPLFIYVFLIGLQGNQTYMAPWSLVVLGVLSANGFALKARDAIDRKLMRQRPVAIGSAALISTRSRV